MSRAKLSSTMLNCILVQTKPGKETEVKNKLEVELKGAKVFLGLGRYDLVVLCEKANFSVFEKFREKHFENIVDWFPVCGGKWLHFGKSRTPWIRKILAVSLVKLQSDGKSWNLDHIELEEQFVSSAFKSDANFQMYSNLSNYGTVCLFSADTLDEVGVSLNTLKDSLILDRKLSAVDLVTIPAVDQSQLDQLNEQVRLSLFLSLNMGISTELMGLLKGLLKKARSRILNYTSAYGFHDVIVSIKGPLGSLIEAILKLRKEGQRYGLISTFTIIDQGGRAKTFEFDSFADMTNAGSNGTEVIHRTRISRQRKELLSHLSRLFGISNNDIFTKDFFRDHTQLIERLRDTIDMARSYQTKNQMEEYQVMNVRFDSAIDCVRLALAQRYCSIVPGNLLATKSLGLEPHGAIQRAILAAECIPLFIFKKLNEDWHGLCVFGYYHRFSHQEGAMFNIPQRYRVDPEKWGGLFHEIGHEVFLCLSRDLRISLDVFLTALTKKVIEKYGDESDTFEDIQRDLTSLTGEIFADLFAFAVGYQCNWEAYKQDLWRELAREFPVDYERLVRSLMVYLTLGPGKGLEMKGQITAQKIRNWIRSFNRIVKRESNRTISKEEIKATERFISDVIKLGKILELFFVKNQFWKSSHTKKELVTILSGLRRGYIHKTDNPLEIISALRSSKRNLTLKEKLTAMLSLCNTYWRLQ